VLPSGLQPAPEMGMLWKVPKSYPLWGGVVGSSLRKVSRLEKRKRRKLVSLPLIPFYRHRKNSGGRRKSFYYPRPRGGDLSFLVRTEKVLEGRKKAHEYRRYRKRKNPYKGGKKNERKKMRQRKFANVKRMGVGQTTFQRALNLSSCPLVIAEKKKGAHAEESVCPSREVTK